MKGTVRLITSTKIVALKVAPYGEALPIISFTPHREKPSGILKLTEDHTLVNKLKEQKQDVEAEMERLTNQMSIIRKQKILPLSKQKNQVVDAANAAAKDISVQIKARKEAVKNVRKIERTIENCLSKIEDCKEELNESLISVEKHRAKLWYV